MHHPPPVAVSSLTPQHDCTAEIERALRGVPARMLGAPRRNTRKQAGRAIPHIVLVSPAVMDHFRIGRLRTSASAGRWAHVQCSPRGARVPERDGWDDLPQDNGDALTEALGIYLRDGRVLLPVLRAMPSPVTTRARAVLDALCAALEGPDPVPVILLCPERLSHGAALLLDRLLPHERHPAAGLDVTLLILRAALFHELGHHVLATRDEERAQRFAERLLTPAERPWFFAFSRLVLAPEYTRYFATRVARRCIPGRTGGRHDLVQRRGLDAHDATASDPSRPLAPALSRRVLLSPPVAGQLSGIAPDALHDRRVRVCDVGPHEEYAQFQQESHADEHVDALLRLLECAPESTQGCAAEALDASLAAGAASQDAVAISHVLARWALRSIQSADPETSRIGWELLGRHRAADLANVLRTMVSGREVHGAARAFRQAERLLVPADFEALARTALTEGHSSVRTTAVDVLATRAVQQHPVDEATLVELVSGSFEDARDAWSAILRQAEAVDAESGIHRTLRIVPASVLDAVEFPGTCHEPLASASGRRAGMAQEANELRARQGVFRVTSRTPPGHGGTDAAAAAMDGAVGDPATDDVADTKRND